MDEIRPEFGNAPECPKGFTPNHKMDAVNEEKRYYRSQWLAEKDRADALAAHVERLRKKAAALTAQVARLIEQRDALAAHVERISEWWGDEAKTKLDLEEFAAIISDQPTTSLARRDAETKLEALEAFGSRNKLGVALHDFLKTTNALHRQLEGGES